MVFSISLIYFSNFSPLMYCMIIIGLLKILKSGSKICLGCSFQNYFSHIISTFFRSVFQLLKMKRFLELRVPLFEKELSKVPLIESYRKHIG